MVGNAEVDDEDLDNLIKAAEPSFLDTSSSHYDTDVHLCLVELRLLRKYVRLIHQLFFVCVRVSVLSALSVGLVYAWRTWL